MAAEILLADKAFDADQRVIEPLLARGKSFVIPPKSNRKVQRDSDKGAYKARHFIENFFCKLKQYRAIATRYDKTASNPPRGCHHLAQLRTGSRGMILNRTLRYTTAGVGGEDAIQIEWGILRQKDLPPCNLRFAPPLRSRYRASFR